MKSTTKALTALAAIGGLALTGCSAATTTTATDAADAAYVTTGSSAPAGYTDLQWDVIVEGAAEYGFTEYEAGIMDDAAYEVWNEGGEYDICPMYYNMSDGAFQDALIYASYNEFGATGEGFVAATATYALALNHC